MRMRTNTETEDIIQCSFCTGSTVHCISFALCNLQFWCSVDLMRRKPGSNVQDVFLHWASLKKLKYGIYVDLMRRKNVSLCHCNRVHRCSAPGARGEEIHFYTRTSKALVQWQLIGTTANGAVTANGAIGAAPSTMLQAKHYPTVESNTFQYVCSLRSA